MKWQTLIKALIICTPLALFFWLLVVDLNPSGQFVIGTNVDERSPYLDRLLPDARALGVHSSADGVYTPVIGEPTYLAVHQPGAYDELTVELTFQNTAQPILELGLIVNDDPIQYTLEPMENRMIDTSSWTRLEQDGTTLLQRVKTYDSIEAFKENPPERKVVATYHAQLDEPYREAAYLGSNTLTTVSASLRGYHEYLTYIKNEPLLLQAAFMDMNRQYGADPVELLAVNETGEIVGSMSVADDGETQSTQKGSTLQNVSLVVPNLPEGVYKVILKADRDIFFRTLTTRQRYMSFVGPVFVGDEVGYHQAASPVKFFTDGKHLSFETYHADAAQAVTIGSRELLLPEAQVRYDVDVAEAGLVAVSAAAGDFFMTGDGFTAFSRTAFFNPNPVKLNWNTNLDDLGVNFIFSNYTPPTLKGNWKIARATFKIPDELKQKKNLKLVLAAPGIETLQNEVRVHRFELTFTRPALTTSEFFQKIVLWFHALVSL